MNDPILDVVVVGGGIVGLATAWNLLQARPGLKVTVLEKESTLAKHQTGHNSGVLHSGIYYKPGSLKAINCRAGKKLMEAFCEEHGVPYKLCGKVITATDREGAAQARRHLRARPGQRHRLRADLRRALPRAGAARAPASARSTSPNPASSTTPRCA